MKYLKYYNALAGLCWLAYLLLWLGSGTAFSTPQLILLTIAQGMAVLEIVHAAVGWVRSPVLLTAAQVASRMLVLVMIHLLFAYPPLSAVSRWGLALISVTWSVTEIIRYGYYYFQLNQQEVKALSWLRYTLFIVFYPLGITGEWLLFTAPLLQPQPHIPFYSWFFAANALIYLLVFPRLYGYMWQQRKKKV